jgi:hypothetical protein
MAQTEAATVRKQIVVDGTSTGMAPVGKRSPAA